MDPLNRPPQKLRGSGKLQPWKLLPHAAYIKAVHYFGLSRQLGFCVSWQRLLDIAIRSMSTHVVAKHSCL